MSTLDASKDTQYLTTDSKYTESSFVADKLINVKRQTFDNYYADNLELCLNKSKIGYSVFDQNMAKNCLSKLNNALLNKY